MAEFTLSLVYRISIWWDGDTKKSYSYHSSGLLVRSVQQSFLNPPYNQIANLLFPELTYSSRTRVLSYFLPSMLGSVILNIPKFLEAKLDTISYTEAGTNDTIEVVIYNVTSLRLDPDYMYYYIHWTRWSYKSINILKIKQADPFLVLRFIKNKMR